MQIINVTQEIDLNVGDIILIEGNSQLIHTEIEEIKVSEQDGVEIIYNLKHNHFFNLDMFLEGKSWVKELMLVKPSLAVIKG